MPALRGHFDLARKRGGAVADAPGIPSPERAPKARRAGVAGLEASVSMFGNLNPRLYGELASAQTPSKHAHGSITAHCGF